MDRKATLKLLVVSVIIGVMIGLTTDLFIRLIQKTSTFIWNNLVPHAQDKKLAVIAITTIGGLLMGACVKFYSTNDGIGFEAVTASIKKEGKLSVIQLPRVVLNTFIGLVTGASVGPEAPLITLGGYMGQALGDKFKLAKKQILGFITIALGGSLGVLVDSPIAGPILLTEQAPTEDPKTNRLLIFCSMVAASVGYAIYVALKAPFISSLHLVPAYTSFHARDLMFALIIGFIGTAIGIAEKTMIISFKGVFSRINKYPIVRGGLVGVFIGLCGAFFPLVLFDGSSQLAHIVSNVSTYSILMLLTLGVVRLLSTSVALSGGYQGGNIFPTIFITGVVGLAISALFPGIPAAVAMVACMASAMFVFIPLPLFTIFLFAELGGFNLIPAMAMSLVGAYIIMQLKPSLFE